MRPYEVMIICDTEAEGPAIQAVVDRLTELVSSSGGSVGNIDRWGRRAFAYEVNHKREGYYLLIEFSATPEIVASLDRLLTLADEVIRFRIIRVPDIALRLAAAGKTKSSASSKPSSKPSSSRRDNPRETHREPADA